MLLANEATYRSLTTFQSVEELNDAIKAHRQAHELSDTERTVLDVISQYACKYVGVCYLSKNKIGAAVGRVRRTIIRICNRLEELGIIKQYETKRPAGDRRQSSNVIVILAFGNSEVGATCHHPKYVRQAHEVENHDFRESAEVQKLHDGNNSIVGESDKQTESTLSTSESVGYNRQNGNYNFQVTPECHTLETPEKAKSNNTYKDTPKADHITLTRPSTDEVIKRGLKHAIPTSIYEAMAPFFDGQTMYDTYGILLRAKASIDRSITVEEYGQAYIDAFMNVVRLYKAGKVRSLSGLLYSTWQAVTSTIKRRVSVDKHPVLYDWLA